MFPNDTTDEHEWMVFYPKFSFKLSGQHTVQLEYFHSRWIQDLPYIPGVWTWGMWKQLYMRLCWSKPLYGIKNLFLDIRDFLNVDRTLRVHISVKTLRCCSTIACIYIPRYLNHRNVIFDLRESVRSGVAYRENSSMLTFTVCRSRMTFEAPSTLNT